MAWIWLVLAGLFEIGWAIGLKNSDGFTKIFVSSLTVVMMVASFFLLSLALKEIPLGTAYAVWTGIGAIGIAIAGMIFFQESHSSLRLICIGLIVAGVLGLKYVEN